MDVILLGIGGMMPMPGRPLASALLRHEGRSTLFDCGEGTQVPLKAGSLGVAHLDRIALTHLHADHVTGIPGLLMLVAQGGERRPLGIVGDAAVCRYVRETRSLLGFHMPYALEFHALDPAGGSIRDDHGTLSWRPLEHRVPIVGYRYDEAPRPGVFSAAAADALGVPPGPLRAALQRGESVEVDGRRIDSEAVVGPPRRGRRVAYVTDTRPCDGARALLDGCDLAIVEGMFRTSHAEQAREKGHLTAVEAAALAREAGVARTLLTHVSPRYDDDELAALEREARDVCPTVELGRPLERVPVPLP